MLRLKTVYSTPLCFEYRASTLSFANIWHFFSFPLSAIIALFLTFATQGLWRRTNTYLERPIVHFNEQLFLLFEDEDGQVQQFWSPVTAWNDNLTFPAFETNTLDIDGDGRPEEIFINILLRSTKGNLTANDKFKVLTFVLFFDVRLDRRAWLQFQMCPVIGKINRPSDSYNALSIIGVLEIDQRGPLPSWGNLTISPFEWATMTLNITDTIDPDNNSNNDILKTDNTNLDINNEDLKTKMNSAIWALQNYQLEQNLLVELSRSIHRWNIHSDASNETNPANFYINYRLRINEQIFVYKTDVWEMLKWAWIQFLAIYIVVRSLFNSLSAFMYQNQILETVFVRPQSLEDWACKIK